MNTLKALFVACLCCCYVYVATAAHVSDTCSADAAACGPLAGPPDLVGCVPPCEVPMKETPAQYIGRHLMRARHSRYLTAISWRNGSSTHAHHIMTDNTPVMLLGNATGLRVGIDSAHGGAISHLSMSRGLPHDLLNANLVNTFDAGRMLQQSWYGCTDGSCWLDRPWRWNPVQAGCGLPSWLICFNSIVCAVCLDSHMCSAIWLQSNEFMPTTQGSVRARTPLDTKHDRGRPHDARPPFARAIAMLTLAHIMHVLMHFDDVRLVRLYTHTSPVHCSSWQGHPSRLLHAGPAGGNAWHVRAVPRSWASQRLLTDVVMHTRVEMISSTMAKV